MIWCIRSHTFHQQKYAVSSLHLVIDGAVLIYPSYSGSIDSEDFDLDGEQVIAYLSVLVFRRAEVTCDVLKRQHLFADQRTGHASSQMNLSCWTHNTKS